MKTEINTMPMAEKMIKAVSSLHYYANGHDWKDRAWNTDPFNPGPDLDRPEGEAYDKLNELTDTATNATDRDDADSTQKALDELMEEGDVDMDCGWANAAVAHIEGNILNVRSICDDAKKATGLIIDALDAANANDWAKANDLAQEAASVERAYGDAALIGPVRDAVEAAFEAVEEASTATAAAARG